jgi:hypothetical protein
VVSFVNKMEERPKRKRGRYFKYKESGNPSFGVVPRSTQWSRKKRKGNSNGQSTICNVILQIIP